MLYIKHALQSMTIYDVCCVFMLLCLCRAVLCHTVPWPAFPSSLSCHALYTITLPLPVPGGVGCWTTRVWRHGSCCLLPAYQCDDAAGWGPGGAAQDRAVPAVSAVAVPAVAVAEAGITHSAPQHGPPQGTAGLRRPAVGRSSLRPPLATPRG